MSYTVAAGGAMGKALGVPMAQGLRVARPRRKVTPKERPTYDRCHAAMHAGALYQWAIDDRTASWQVQLADGGDWSSHSLEQVGELLAELGQPVPSTPARKAPARVIVDKHTAPTPNIKREETPTMNTTPDPVHRPPVPNTPSSDTLDAYLGRLIYGPKKDYAAALAAHLQAGAPRPDDPGKDWARKVETKLERLFS
jgi:hypothetical protein